MSQPATDDPFDALGLPHTFRLDPTRIRAAHVRLLAAAHPDRAGRDAPSGTPLFAGRHDAARDAARINAAQRVLSDPLERAKALLASLGGSLTDRLSPQFLAEAMELREALDEAVASGDRSRIVGLHNDALAQRDAEIELIAAAFDKATAEDATKADRSAALIAASEGVARLRYVTRMLEESDRGSESEATSSGQ